MGDEKEGATRKHYLFCYEPLFILQLLLVNYKTLRRWAGRDRLEIQWDRAAAGLCSSGLVH